MASTCLPPPIPPTLSSTEVVPPKLHGTMAATPDQLALTKSNRPSAVSTSTRQAVPAFLNKLYNMVSNPETDELVRWSDEGDSFYIPSHERLSKELLPRFFKHGNFSSFVRQLNMYGFHKVPHLQQGVLQNSTETELWQFQNPHFQRGQPDLLCLITRKKTGGGADNTTDDAQHSNHAIGPSNGSSHAVNAANGPLDMTVLTSSLAAIKKHQTSLSAELKTLQESNQHLWTEALAARDRHKKHQDTINKILKFLASVFGNGAAGSPSAGPGGSSPAGRDGRASPGALVPRKRPRLMIENGSADDDRDEDEEEYVQFTDTSMHGDHEMSEARISEAPSEGAPSPAPVPANMTAKTEPPPTPSLATPASSLNTPLDPFARPMAVARRSSSQTATPLAPTSSASTSTHPDPPESQTHPLFGIDEPHAQDQLYQETISKLLNSPSTLQRILATLSSQGPDPTSGLEPSTYQSELAPYHGGELMNMHPNTSTEVALDPGLARLDQSTEALGAEIDNAQHDIDALMQGWGITPDMLHAHGVGASGNVNELGGPNGAGFSSVNGHEYGAQPNIHVNGFVPPNGAPGTYMSHGGYPNGAPTGTTEQPYASIAHEGDHVDIESFLNQLEFSDDPTSGTTTTADHSAGAFSVPLSAQFDLENPGSQLHSAAFLDEVHPVPSAASDTSLSPAIPLLDDFGSGTGTGLGVGAMNVGRPPSPTVARFPTPTAPPAPATAPAPAPAVNGAAPKRGKKRRSVVAEAPSSAEEPTLPRSTRHK